MAIEAVKQLFWYKIPRHTTVVSCNNAKRNSIRCEMSCNSHLIYRRPVRETVHQKMPRKLFVAASHLQRLVGVYTIHSFVISCFHILMFASCNLKLSPNILFSHKSERRSSYELYQTLYRAHVYDSHFLCDL